MQRSSRAPTNEFNGVNTWQLPTAYLSQQLDELIEQKIKPLYQIIDALRLQITIIRRRLTKLEEHLRPVPNHLPIPLPQQGLQVQFPLKVPYAGPSVCTESTSIQQPRGDTWVSHNQATKRERATDIKGNRSKQIKLASHSPQEKEHAIGPAFSDSNNSSVQRAGPGVTRCSPSASINMPASHSQFESCTSVSKLRAERYNRMHDNFRTDRGPAQVIPNLTMTLEPNPATTTLYKPPGPTHTPLLRESCTTTEPREVRLGLGSNTIVQSDDGSSSTLTLFSKTPPSR